MASLRSIFSVGSSTVCGRPDNGGSGGGLRLSESKSFTRCTALAFYSGRIAWAPTTHNKPIRAENYDADLDSAASAQTAARVNAQAKRAGAACKAKMRGETVKPPKIPTATIMIRRTRIVFRPR